MSSPCCSQQPGLAELWLSTLQPGGRVMENRGAKKQRELSGGGRCQEDTIEKQPMAHSEVDRTCLPPEGSANLSCGKISFQGDLSPWRTDCPYRALSPVLMWSWDSPSPCPAQPLCLQHLGGCEPHQGPSPQTSLQEVQGINH